MIPAGARRMTPKLMATRPLKVLGVYVVDKTKPLASPAPQGGERQRFDTGASQEGMRRAHESPGRR